MNKYELRELTAQYLQLVLDWRNKDNIRLNMINPSKISWEDHCNWFTGLQTRQDRQVMVFCINDKPVGIVSFVDITEDSCSWGFYIGEENVHKGAGLLLGYYGIEYAFNNYAINKIESQVIDFNEASIAFHKKLFFVQIGVAEKALYRDDICRDMVLFELLKETWVKVKTEVLSQALSKIEGRN